MQTLTVACVQPRMSIPASREELEAALRRFLRQPQARSAQLVIFPELFGTLFAPVLISPLKLRFIKRADQGRQPTAGFLARSVGRVAQATADAMGGGFAGSLARLLDKNSGALCEAYEELFARLAREFSVTIAAGSIYLRDEETQMVRNRAYLFSSDGEILGQQDKLHLTPTEDTFAAPGTALTLFQTNLGRMGILVGRDALYPELARLLAIQGADVVIGLAGALGTAQGRMLRSALALRAEENQVFSAVSFLIGPNHLDRENPVDYRGRSAIMSPISLTETGDGILIQAGSDRTEAVIAAGLDLESLHSLRETSRFRPRHFAINLGGLGHTLADFYQSGRTIEQASQERVSVPEAQVTEPPAFVKVVSPEAKTEPESEEDENHAPAVDSGSDQPATKEPVPPSVSIPEALSLTSKEPRE